MKAWKVRDVMTTNVATVAEGTPYREVVDLMTSRHVSGVPVVDDAGLVLGVISEADLLYKVEMIGEPHERRIFEGRRRHAARVKADALIARELMAAPAVTASASTSLVEAAKRMEREHVKRLPVTDSHGRLLGIVSRADLLKVHLRPDEDIRRDVLDGGLKRVLASEEATIDVTVADGVVTLSGRLVRHSAVQIAANLASQVSGVVQVVDGLTYEFDDLNPAYLKPGLGNPAGLL
ncbi:CBS domain-containing protein [Asanoa sp. NPDC049573]|uniref:CBS domain-containing protein n=1 Tax=Asanoa sp. NPDC049573 TaxID=3155396 RepID=UPI00341EC2CF